LNDLVYLTDPFIRTTDFVLDQEQKIDHSPANSRG
jgi:hypothetical protein